MKTLITIGILSILATSVNAASLGCVASQAPEANQGDVTSGTFRIYSETATNIIAGGELGSETYTVKANILQNSITLSSMSDDKRYVSTTSTDGKADLTLAQDGMIMNIFCFIK